MGFDSRPVVVNDGFFFFDSSDFSFRVPNLNGGEKASKNFCVFPRPLLVCCSSSCKSAFNFNQSTAFLLCERAMTKPKLAASVSKSAYKPDLVPRVVRLFGQRSNAADDQKA